MAAVVSGMFTVFVKNNTPDSPLATAFNPAMQMDKDPNAYEMVTARLLPLTKVKRFRLRTRVDRIQTSILS